MDLLLAVRVDGVARRDRRRGATDMEVARVDVAVEIDPRDTVAGLVEALVDLVHGDGSAAPAPGGWELRAARAPQPFHPATSIADSGLVSGETVQLAPVPPQRLGPIGPARVPPPASEGDDRDAGLSLDVTAGPEAGRRIRLTPGDVTVGRASSCGVAIDDPTVSRHHFILRVTAAGDVSVLPNPDATNGTVAGVDPMRGPGPVRPGETVRAGASAFAVRVSQAEPTRPRDRLGQVPFNRVPYRPSIVSVRRFDELAAPPAAAPVRRLALAAALLPALSAVALAAMTGRWYLLGLAALSPLLVAWRSLADRRHDQRVFADDRAAFRARVEARAADIDRALADERRERLAASPDLADLVRRATSHSSRLWERNRSATDVLELRIGLGNVASQVSAAVERGGGDALRASALDRLAHQATVHDAPVTVNLVDVGVLGVWGDPQQVRSLAGALLVQAACLHSPEDLVVAAAVGRDEAPGVEWLKWLPHVRSSTSPLDGEHLAVGPDATRLLLARLLGVAHDRRPPPAASAAPVWPRMLVAVGEAAAPDPALLSQLAELAPAAGIHLLWLGRSERQVPRQCGAVVSWPGGRRRARLRFTAPNRPDQSIEVDGIPAGTATEVARALAPLRDASASTPTTAIPRVVALFDILGIARAPHAEIAARWREPQPGLGGAIGMAADGPLVVDLVEHGPHMLIGGTSGAGKSELLQTLVLSLAAGHRPDRLNFLFVDYKGGASTAELRQLPHTVGYVTNLSGRLSQRALTSLRAELRRRMALLEGRAKDLAELQRRTPHDAPARLVIVIDELAALLHEVPDFVAGIVDIAQRGRSLGIHLVLATQRPTGVVNDNVLANTNLRVALRTLDPADSTNVIGTRAAADIPLPLRGRAYARLGPQVLVAFQSAWSGAPYAAAGDAAARVRQPAGVPCVWPFRFGATGRSAAAARAAGAPLPSPDGGEPLTQLAALVDACRSAARVLSVPPARRPWVEPLGDLVSLATALDQAPADDLVADPGRVLVLGLADDPGRQDQPVAAVDLEATGGLLVFGAGGSGKTTLLRTAAAGLAAQGDADQVRIYALDFASRALDALASLPQCGAVVRGDDLERVTRLLTILLHEIDRRRDALAAARAETLGALRQRAAASVMPRLVVLLDGYSGFHDAFDRVAGACWLSALERIVSSGRQVGVHCVITSERRHGVPAALQSAVSARLALRMATPEELAALGVPLPLARAADLPAGRGYLDGATEVQLACIGDDPSGVGQAEALARTADELAARADARAPALPELPAEVTFERPAARPAVHTAASAPDGCRGGPRLAAPLALEDLSLEVVAVDLARRNLVVAGPPLSGRSTALDTVARGIRGSSDPALHLVALGGAVSLLARLDVWDDAAFGRSAQAGLVERLARRLAAEEGADARAVLFVDAAEDLEGGDVVRRLDALVRCDALRIVVACDIPTVARAYSGWLSGLRRSCATLVLQPDSPADIDAAAGVRPSLRPAQVFPAGRGIWVAERRWALVQVGRYPSP